MSSSLNDLLLFHTINCVFQFNSFMVVIRDMLSRMEAEHKTKLEQLHVMQEQQRSLAQRCSFQTVEPLLFILIKYLMVIHIDGDCRQHRPRPGHAGVIGSLL